MSVYCRDTQIKYFIWAAHTYTHTVWLLILAFYRLVQWIFFFFDLIWCVCVCMNNKRMTRNTTLQIISFTSFWQREQEKKQKPQATYFFFSSCKQSLTRWILWYFLHFCTLLFIAILPTTAIVTKRNDSLPRTFFGAINARMRARNFLWKIQHHSLGFSSQMRIRFRIANKFIYLCSRVCVYVFKCV